MRSLPEWRAQRLSPAYLLKERSGRASNAQTFLSRCKKDCGGNRPTPRRADISRLSLGRRGRQVNAALAFGAFGPDAENVIPELLLLASDPQFEGCAVKGLNAIGGRGIDALIELSHSPNSDTRRHCLATLSELPKP